MSEVTVTRRLLMAFGFCAFTMQMLSPALADDWTYLDDRSTPQKLVESYYAAISNGSYAQAYSYFQQGSAPARFTGRCR